MTYKKIKEVLKEGDSSITNKEINSFIIKSVLWWFAVMLVILNFCAIVLSTLALYAIGVLLLVTVLSYVSYACESIDTFRKQQKVANKFWLIYIIAIILIIATKMFII